MSLQVYLLRGHQPNFSFSQRMDLSQFNSKETCRTGGSDLPLPQGELDWISVNGRIACGKGGLSSAKKTIQLLLPPWEVYALHPRTQECPYPTPHSDTAHLHRKCKTLVNSCFWGGVEMGKIWDGLFNSLHHQKLCVYTHTQTHIHIHLQERCPSLWHENPRPRHAWKYTDWCVHTCVVHKLRGHG